MRTARFRSYCAACAVAALATAGLAACGDSDDPQELSFEVGTKGKTVEITAPASAEAGVAEITLTNKTNSEADLQLIRVEGDRSAQEVVDGLGKAIEGEPFPDWFFAGGGVGGIGPGKSATVSQVLQPGTYYAFDTQARVRRASRRRRPPR